MDNVVPLTNAKDQIWYSTEGDVVKIGFTASFLKRMEECWHVLPASTSEVSEKSPLMAVETNDSLLSIRSPVTGRITSFNPKALNFPDKLVSSDIIFQVNTNRKAVVPVPEVFVNVRPDVNAVWHIEGELAAAAPLRPIGDFLRGHGEVPAMSREDALAVGRTWRMELEGMVARQEAEQAQLERNARLAAGIRPAPQQRPAVPRAPNPPGNPIPPARPTTRNGRI